MILLFELDCDKEDNKSIGAYIIRRGLFDALLASGKIRRGDQGVR